MRESAATDVGLIIGVVCIIVDWDYEGGGLKRVQGSGGVRGCCVDPGFELVGYFLPCAAKMVFVNKDAVFAKFSVFGRNDCVNVGEGKEMGLQEEHDVRCYASHQNDVRVFDEFVLFE